MALNKADPRDDQDQSAESELQRLQKQVFTFNRYKYLMYNAYEQPFFLMQLRKMEKERSAFIEDKKCKSIQKLKMLQTLKTERDNLRQIINSFHGGQHAKRTSEVQRKS